MGFGIRIRNEDYASGAVLYGTLSECLEDLGFHDFMRELWDREGGCYNVEYWQRESRDQ